MQPRCSYLICATARSGSTLLCEALDNTGIAGHPEEYFEALKASGLPRRPHEYFEDMGNRELAKRLEKYFTMDSDREQGSLHHEANYADYLTCVLVLVCGAK